RAGQGARPQLLPDAARQTPLGDRPQLPRRTLNGPAAYSPQRPRPRPPTAAGPGGRNPCLCANACFTPAWSRGSASASRPAASPPPQFPPLSTAGRGEQDNDSRLTP